MESSIYRAIEGAVELRFGDTEDGDIIENKQTIINFLNEENFEGSDIEEYIEMFDWDEEGNCINEIEE